MTDAKGCQATPHGTLLEQIMDATQAKSEREWAALREIETLRQQIAELEGYKQECANLDAELTDYQDCLAELAALKQQGEPPAWIRGSGLEMLKSGDGIATVYRSDGMSNHSTPLYTSASTIPEGYVLVPVEPTSEMFDAAEVAFEGGSDGIWHAMLAASPKPQAKGETEMTEHEAFGIAYHEEHARYPDPDNWYDVAVFRWWQRGQQAANESESNRAVIAELLQELRNIANADTFAWDDRTEFEAWAKNRARAAIAKHDTSTTTAKEQ